MNIYMRCFCLWLYIWVGQKVICFFKVCMGVLDWAVEWKLSCIKIRRAEFS